MMHNWNMVSMVYCDGGSFSGDRATLAMGREVISLQAALLH
jgi:hypothetical protein